MSNSLDHIVKHVAATPVLLVATDFDGTLAPLVEHHDRATASPTAMAALARLGMLPRTHVAVVSGRGLADLRVQLGWPRQWELSGSHGAELSGEADLPVPAEGRGQLDKVTERLASVARVHKGCFVEHKPRGVAFHYRGVADEIARVAVDAITDLATQFPALSMRCGSMVIEFLVDRFTKADGLHRLRDRAGATAVIFIGDDLTDEDAFASLQLGDAGVKVGQGDTQAQFRVESVGDVERLLERLADEREAWLARSGN